jgi:hypothetical protein
VKKNLDNFKSYFFKGIMSDQSDNNNNSKTNIKNVKSEVDMPSNRTTTDYILELSDPPIFFEHISSSTKIFYDKDNQQIFCVRSNGVGGNKTKKIPIFSSQSLSVSFNFIF